MTGADFADFWVLALVDATAVCCLALRFCEAVPERLDVALRAVFDLAGFAGSSLWAVWLIALGVAVLRAPIRRPTVAAAAAPSHA